MNNKKKTDQQNRRNRRPMERQEDNSNLGFWLIKIWKHFILLIAAVVFVVYIKVIVIWVDY